MSEAGDYENMKAMEQAMFENFRSVMDITKKTRKEVAELRITVDSLKSNLHANQGEIIELRRQLGILQQRFYEKGTTSYSDSDGRELADESD